MATYRTGEARGKQQILAFGRCAVFLHERDRGQTVGQSQGRLETLGESLLHVRPDLEAIDDDIDAVFLVLFQFRREIDFSDDAIDAGPHITAGLQFAEHM